MTLDGQPRDEERQIGMRDERGIAMVKDPECEDNNSSLCLCSTRSQSLADKRGPYTKVARPSFYDTVVKGQLEKES